MAVDVYDPAFLNKLDRLRVRLHRGRGIRPGSTPVPRHSQPAGIEFEKYKNYACGDDLRYLDWNVLGRLDQLLIKTFTAEREIPFHIILDGSASMAVPRRAQKFALATQLAAVIAYVVLANNDLVRLAAWSDGTCSAAAAPLRHRSSFLAVKTFLQELAPHGGTRLGEAARRYLDTVPQAGVAILLSDFLVEVSDSQEALGAFCARGFEVKAIHILSPEEMDPQHRLRRGRLRDVESGQTRMVTGTDDNLRRYREALAAHLEAVRDFCYRRHIFYALALTHMGIETVVTAELLRLGLFRLR